MKKVLLSLALAVPCLLNAQLVINEVATSNMGYATDEDGDASDWIEIYNAGAVAVNIGEYGLTDDTSQWNKWQLPAININAGARKIIYASAKNRGCFACGGGSHLHTNFKLSEGETVALYNNAGVLLDSITLPRLRSEHTMQRIPDGSAWCFSSTPTPNAINAGTCYTGYAAQPLMITQPGFYTGSVNVELSGGEVRYTIDGDWPDAGSALYTAPVSLVSSQVVRAVGIEAGKLPSWPVTGTFLINETTALPVVSISSNSCDMFDEGWSCAGAYDNATGWNENNPQIPATIEYFTADKQRQFVSDIKFEVAGNSSIAVYPQRSMQFTVDEDFNSLHEIQYNIFQHDKPQLDSLPNFRIRANLDWGNSAARMKDLIVNRMALPTHANAAAYQNCAAFINGEYFGHFSPREELDEFYLRNNFGCNPDSVVIIKSGAGDVTWETCEIGSMTEYNNLYTYFTTHPMSNAANYAEVQTMIDVENWVDWMATQTFIDNEEMPYNTRFFKSNEPEMRWQFILWDCGAGAQCETCNTQAGLMHNSYGGQTREVIMFDDLLASPDFKKYYINRYADLMNYYFIYSKVQPLIEEDNAEISAEIPAQLAVWGFPTVAAYNSGVTELKGFYDNRSYFVRNDIQSYFSLAGQVSITLQANPPEAGYIKISTIIPETLPWTGVYFNGNPVTVTAIANPGYTFEDWDANAFIVDPTAISFTNNFTSSTTFTANFTGSSLVNPIVISEVNYNSDSTLNGGDWVELHNTSDVDVSIGDYVFSRSDFYNTFKIPAGTILAAHDYLVLVQDTAEFFTQHPGVTNVLGNFIFPLGNDGDSLSLRDFLGHVVTAFKFDDNQPWPATADGFGRTMEFAFDLADPKLPASWFAGCIGGSPGTGYSPCMENPIVEEINYHSSPTSDAGDWFEIMNSSADNVDLSGWKIKDKNENVFIIPGGTILNANSYLAFYTDGTKFTAQFPDVTNAIGPLPFGLSGSDDVLLIYDADGKIYQSVGYDDQAPYPLSPDGGGTALQMVNIYLNMNDAINWTESCPDGTPGSEYLTPCANAVDEEPLQTNIAVYPNPSNEYIAVVPPSGLYGSGALNIFDITGKLVYQSTVDLQTTTGIQLNNFSPGVYSIQLSDKGEMYWSNFIKN